MLGMSVEEQAEQAVKHWVEHVLEDSEELADALAAAFEKAAKDKDFSLYYHHDDPTESWCHRQGVRYIESHVKEMSDLVYKTARAALPDDLNLN